MISVEDRETFEHYNQAEYDFNTSSLSEQEILKIKTLAKQQRVNYNLAPIGEQIFRFITEQSPEVHFESVELDTDKVDGMLYIPENGKEKAYIIINKKKDLINQIFAAAHEYYHYIADYESIKEKPYVCCLSALKDTNEKKASRFAAELLLPEEALRQEITNFRMLTEYPPKKHEFVMYGTISLNLTVKYQMPLKAVIYRLYEEKYIKDIKIFIENYEVIKNLLLNIEILKKSVDHLYATENSLIDGNGLIYQQIEKAYIMGEASREEILKDAASLELNPEIVNSFFDDFDDLDEEEDDTELTRAALEKWGGN